MKICIISIFINEYYMFFEGWYKSFTEKFFPNNELYFYVFTNRDLLNVADNVYIYKIDGDYIQWPIPTLYRFKYIKMIDTKILKSFDYIFFSNSNTICNKIINQINLSYDYTFTLHSYFHHLSGLEIINNKHLFGDIDTKDIINYDWVVNDKYQYIGGRFFGAKPDNFIYLTNTIYNSIGNNLKNNVIHQWHDETELNLFFFKNIKMFQYNILDISYHIDENQKLHLPADIQHNLIYLDKTIHLRKTSYNERNPFKQGITNHIGRANTVPRELYHEYITVLDNKKITEIYYINLNRSQDRNNLMINQFDNIKNVKYKRISAIDGKNDTLEKYSHLDSNRYLNKKTVLACLLSHLTAIKQAYENNLKQVIILEDDIDLTIYKEVYQNVNRFLDNINKTDIDIIQLFSINCEVYPKKYNSQLKLNIIERNDTYWGTQAYLITSSGMEKIMELYDNNNDIFKFPDNYRLIADYFIYEYLNTKFINLPLVGVFKPNEFISEINSDILTQENMYNYLNTNTKLIIYTISKYMEFINESTKHQNSQEEQRLEEQRLEEQRLEEQRLEEPRLEEQRLEEQQLEEQQLTNKELTTREQLTTKERQLTTKERQLTTKEQQLTTKELQLTTKEQQLNTKEEEQLNNEKGFLNLLVDEQKELFIEKILNIKY